MKSEQLTILRNLVFSRQRLSTLDKIRDDTLRQLECIEKEIFEEKLQMNQLLEEAERCQN